MQVVVRLFASYREAAGASELRVDLPAGATVQDAIRATIAEHPSIGGRRPAIVARNREYVSADEPLADGDEVALIPPVSGGAFLLSDEPLSLDAVVREVASADAGAIATFTGTVRRESRGRSVLHLEYEAYEEMAEATIERIADDLRARYDLRGVAIHHRVGRVGVGEASVVIAVSAPHRADALAACKDAIDTLKETVPLWKKEVYAGGEEWIGRGS